MLQGLCKPVAIALFACLVSAGIDPVELASYQDQRLTVSIAPARLGQQVGLVAWFDCTDDLHIYADPATAPSPQSALHIEPIASGLRFGRPVYPASSPFYDQGLARPVQVFSGRFPVFVPVSQAPDRPVEVHVTITGLACTSQVCLPPFNKTLTVDLDFSGQIQTISMPSRSNVGQHGMILLYILLGLLAGLSINIMPCVLPILPLIVLRLVKQSAGTSRQRLMAGLTFCGGMIGFFVLLAVVAVGVNLATDQALQINGIFRYQGAAIALFLILIILALVLFDIVNINLPSGLTNRIGGPEGIASFGTGFLAALLSIPCSGALLGFVLVWAQTQPAIVSATVIVIIGIGMALPYAVLMTVPGLLQKLPRPGRWMDFFKKSCGFLVLLVAVKLTLTTLPKERLIGLLSYTVIFVFCVWIWGSWADPSTSTVKRWSIRAIAIVLAVVAGMYLLAQPRQDLIKWQAYDRQLIAAAQQAGRPVLLKFTADWCTNCVLLDRLVYNDSKVAQMITSKGILAVKADTTLHDAPATEDLNRLYGQAGNVPVCILLLPNGHKEVLRGIFRKDKLLGLLGALPEKGAL